MREVLSRPSARVAVGFAAAAIGFGASPEVAAEAAQIKTDQCPSTKVMFEEQHVPAACETFLMKVIRNSVYDDAADNLAVATYQKIANRQSNAGLTVDGDLGPRTARMILHRKALRPSSPHKSMKGKELFIRKSDQVAYVLGNGAVKHIFSISSGSGIAYKNEIGRDGKPYSGDATTPTGNFKINERVHGPVHIPAPPLGDMPYARYFYRGFAIHAGNVSPTGRQSHGCIRFNYGTMQNIVAPKFNTGDRIKIVE